MKKKNFISLVFGVIGGMLFAIGMCLCLLPEWNAFYQGVIISVVGAVILLILLFIRRKTDGKPSIKLNWKTVGIIAFGVISTLVLGVGMCMVMVWDGLMIRGIIVGVVGILLLLFLIPMCKGLK